jgi:hypothetical protein
MASDGLASIRAAALDLRRNGSDMTGPDRDRPDRAQQLEDIVDQLDEKVAGEREAEGVPGKPSDREREETRGSEAEPPD